MSASIVCLLAALSAAPDTDGLPPIYVPGKAFVSVIRAQSEEGTQGYDVLPPSDADAAQSDPFLAPQGGQYLGPAQPYGGNPYAGRPGCGPGPCQGGRRGIFAFGPNGPQPYRWGWTHRYDVGFLPKEPTENGLGQFGVFEFDAEWEYTTRISPGAIFSFTQQFDMRSWDGPTASATLPTVSMPGNVFHVGWDFELATPGNGPWSAQIAFNPSINSDFDSSLSSNAWNFDSRGILFYRPSPQVIYAFGAGFWDRVNDKVVPYAGVIWNPNNRWEWRLIFPEPRATYYMGDFWGFAHWAYVRGEYHIEAYETQMELSGTREKVELEDWRILFGIRKKNRWLTTFFEAGWVFDRSVAFANGTPGFDVSSGFIARGGIRY